MVMYKYQHIKPENVPFSADIIRGGHEVQLSKIGDFARVRGGRWQRIHWGAVNEEYQAFINVNNNKIIL